jgi:hypothetical protein
MKARERSEGFDDGARARNERSATATRDSSTMKYSVYFADGYVLHRQSINGIRRLMESFNNITRIERE